MEQKEERERGEELHRAAKATTKVKRKPTSRDSGGLHRGREGTEQPRADLKETPLKPLQGGGHY